MSSKPGPERQQPVAPVLRRKPISLAAEDLVSSRLLVPERTLPYVFQPNLTGIPLLGWINTHRPQLEAAQRLHGAVLLRGFGAVDVDTFEALIGVLCGELLEYMHRSTPRTRVSGRIFSSTEYPDDQTIPLHNELSYTRAWAERLFLCCLVVPAAGGETPIADSRRVYARIPAQVRERFERHGVLYVRNYGPHVDLAWQDAFQTDDAAQVDAYCRAEGIQATWSEAGRLRTAQVCQATLRHPSTGEHVWFNQAHLFHDSALPVEVRSALLAALGPAALPRNAYYGDGSPIEVSVLDEIRAAYEAETSVFSWQAGDVLMLDNVLAAHGRRPYKGPRKVVVGMAGMAGRAAGAR